MKYCGEMIFVAMVIIIIVVSFFIGAWEGGTAIFESVCRYVLDDKEAKYYRDGTIRYVTCGSDGEKIDLDLDKLKN